MSHIYNENLNEDYLNDDAKRLSKAKIATKIKLISINVRKHAN